MAKSSKTKSAKQRTKLNGLPAKAKTLTAKEAKKVKGGWGQNDDGHGGWSRNDDGHILMKKPLPTK